MWILLLVGVAMFLGLTRSRAASWDRRIVLAAVAVTIGYMAVRKHLL